MNDNEGAAGAEAQHGDQHAIEHDVDARLNEDTGTFDLQTGSDSGTAGLPAKEDVPQETLEEIEEERSNRLDEANSPENAAVDNSNRTFDGGSGRFTDDPDYDPNDRPFAAPDEDAPPVEQAAEAVEEGDQEQTRE